MALFNKIQDGFTLGVTSPVVSGIEDWLYLYNETDFTETYNLTNPLIVTGLTPADNTKFLWKFTGTNNSFKRTVKSNKTIVGPRYNEEITFNIAGNSSNVKQMVMAAGYGRVRCIVVNNFKVTDSAIELYGANNGMLCEVERDENSEGGWILKLVPPDKLLEPYPPRAISIAPVSGSATYASTLAAIEALVGVNT
jgi:hypothetical protein